MANKIDLETALKSPQDYVIRYYDPHPDGYDEEVDVDIRKAIEVAKELAKEKDIKLTDRQALENYLVVHWGFIVKRSEQ